MADSDVIKTIESLRERVKRLERDTIEARTVHQRAQSDLTEATTAAKALGLDLKNPAKAYEGIVLEAEVIEEMINKANTTLEKARSLINGGD